MGVNPSRSSLVVSEGLIVEACGETPIPELGLIEQVLETDPIPRKEISDYAAKAFRSLPLGDIADGGEIALGVGSVG